LRIIETVLASNEARKRAMARKVAHVAGGLQGKTVAILGLTFKAGTDDVRDAPSIPLIQALIDQGASVQAFDPQGMAKARAVLPRTVRYCHSAYDAVRSAHAAVVVTEWDEFLALDFRRVRQLMRSPLVVDLRNLLKRANLERFGFCYVQIGERPGVLDYVKTLVHDVRLRSRARPAERNGKSLPTSSDRRKLIAAE